MLIILFKFKLIKIVNYIHVRNDEYELLIVIQNMFTIILRSIYHSENDSYTF